MHKGSCSAAHRRLPVAASAAIAAALACSGSGEPTPKHASPRPRGPQPGASSAPSATTAPGETSAQAPEPALRCAPPTTAVPFELEGLPGWACADARGRRQGAFVASYPDGAPAATGSYRDDVLDGPWRRMHPNGELAEVGAYTKGRKDGAWQVYADDGDLLGEYRMLAGTGVERRWFADGRLAGEQSFVDGVLHGASKRYGRDDSELYQARFERGVLDGVRRFGPGKGLRLEDRWRTGVPRGVRKVWRRGALALELSFDDDGLLHGAFTAWRDRRTLREAGAFVHGDRHGTWKWIGRDGKLEREGTYFLGLRHGKWRQWSDGRLIMQGAYVKGRPHGTFRYWNAAGVALGKCKLRHGTGELLTFHDNGEVATRTTLIRGMRHGRYQELSPRGKVLVSGSYANDLRHGAWVERDAEGRLVRESRYVEGKLDGVLRRYWRGQLASETTYVAGVRQGPYRELAPGDDGARRELVSGAFAADRKAGAWVFRRPNGEIALTAQFRDGELWGSFRQRDDQGELGGQYLAGRRTGTWSWKAADGGKRTVEYPTFELGPPPEPTADELERLEGPSAGGAR